VLVFRYLLDACHCVSATPRADGGARYAKDVQAYSVTRGAYQIPAATSNSGGSGSTTLRSSQLILDAGFSAHLRYWPTIHK
jgi:hypothetical protein